MSTKDKLNAAIQESIAKGNRPYRCFGCGDWFEETGRNGRPRVICNNPECYRIRVAWTRNGRYPIADTRRTKLPERAETALLFEVAA